MTSFSETNSINPKLLPLPLPEESQGQHHKRVAFPEITKNNYRMRAGDSKSSPGHKHGPGRFRTACFTICAWTCLGLTTLLLLVLIFGAASVSTFRSALPEIRITKLSPKLRLTNRDSLGQRVLNSDTNFTVEFTNGNERVALSYGSLAIQMSSEQIKLGQTNVGGFFQATGNVTSLNVRTSVKNSRVDDPDAGQLNTNFNQSVMVVDVSLSANVKFHLGGLNTHGMPLETKCENVRQADIYGGSSSKCSVKLLYMKYLNF